ncbi:MAG: hypothetical protein JXA52_03010 [Planctomycetes bacterium]|nr:hypothetical protein [Planctomycetota bacterium]
MKTIRLPILFLAQGLLVVLLAMLLASLARAGETEVVTDLQQRMDDNLDRLLIADGERKAEAQRLVEVAIKNMLLEQYEDAKQRLEKACRLDPMNLAAHERLKEVNALLPSSPDDGTDIIRREEHTSIIRKQHNLAEIKNLLSLAADKLERAADVSGEETDAQELRKAIHLLQQASDDLQRVNLKVKILSAEMNVEEQRSKAISLQREIKELQAELAQREKETSMANALQEMEANEVRQREYLQQQQNTLLQQARKHMEFWQWEEAEAILEQILEQTPGHQEADKLLRELKKQEVANRNEEIADQARVERKTVLLDIAESAIADEGTINYPSDWLEMVKRREEDKDLTLSGDLPPWKAKILEELKKTLPTLVFEDSDIYEVAEQLSSQTGINYIINLTRPTYEPSEDIFDEGGGPPPDQRLRLQQPDEEEGELDIPTVTLNLSNITLENALKWIMTYTGLTYKIDREAIVIGEPDTLGGDMILEVYDVADLIESINNADPTLDTDDDDDDDDDDENQIDLDDIIRRISYDTWGEGRGTIRILDTQFAIYQSETVHQQIKEVLAQLRAAQAIQVAIAARFLEVQDVFFEEFNASFPIINNYMSQSLTPDGIPKMDQAELEGPVFDQSIRGKHYTWAGGETGNISLGRLSSLFGTTTVPATGDGLQFLFDEGGWLGKLRLQWFLQMIRYSDAADVMFAPHLVVYNNKLGSIQILGQSTSVGGYEVAEGGGWEPDIVTNDSGTVLEVRPTVTADKRFIDLDIRTEVTTYAPTGTTSVTSSGDDDVSLLPIDLYTSRIQQTYTTATVPDGGTILISGLSANLNSRQKTGVPVVSDLPIIGKAFGLRNSQKDKQTIMILINARMILLDEAEAALIR